MSENEVGIRKLLGLHYYVHDLERSRRFYTERLGFAEIGCSSPALEQAGRQRSLVFQADDIVITCSSGICSFFSLMLRKSSRVSRPCTYSMTRKYFSFSSPTSWTWTMLR